MCSVLNTKVRCGAVPICFKCECDSTIECKLRSIRIPFVLCLDLIQHRYPVSGFHFQELVVSMWISIICFSSRKSTVALGSSKTVTPDETIHSACVNSQSLGRASSAKPPPLFDSVCLRLPPSSTFACTLDTLHTSLSVEYEMHGI